MKPTIPALAIIAAVSGLAQAEIVIDVSGAEFRDGIGDPDNQVIEVFLGAFWQITNIAWDLNLTTLTDPGASFPSWASEANIDFNGQLNLQVSGTAAGVVNEINTGSADVDLTLGADGILRMEFWESFDDSPGMADAFLGEGSTITIPSPTPGPLAAVGIGGLFAARRRR